jgi:hypothetical protein
MIAQLSRRARLASYGFAVASLALLTGCINSNGPLLTDGQPLVGDHPLLQFYVLRDGAVQEPSMETFRWRDGRYVPTGGTATDIGAFTLHAFAGPDLIVQSIRPGHPSEYAVVRKLADGTYLVFAVEEQDADDATRAKYCSSDHGDACLVATPEAVLAFARATAAKPHAAGGLALLMAEP